MKQLLIFILLIVISLSIDYSYQDITFNDDELITVYIKGEVNEEKAINITKYSTIEDALEYVEISEDADLDNINPLTILHDNDVINIPKREETITINKISINYGTKEELISLPGIGESTADKIIKYREENGLFQNIEDIKNVSGIGDSKYEKMLPYICLWAPK